jgi:hypothetical protein
MKLKYLIAGACILTAAGPAAIAQDQGKELITIPKEQYQKLLDLFSTESPLDSGKT